MELEGHIVEFLDSGSLRLGYVRKRDQRKIHVIDPRGRQSSIPVSRVVVVHDNVPEEDFPAAALAIAERVETMSEEIDIELLWESVQSQTAGRDSSEFSRSYFTGTTPETTSAMFRALSAGRLFFRRNGTLFEPRSKRHVDSERLRVTREQEKDAFRNRVTGLLDGAIRNGPPLDDPDWKPIADGLEAWLRRRERNEISGLLEEMAGDAHSRETAYGLLLDSKRIAPSEDRFLVTHGIPPAFPIEAIEAAERLTPYVSDGTRRDRSGLVTLTIDDDETVEVDDALTIHEQNGQTVVGIHIADLTAFVTRNDVLDREAYRRLATVYLPNVSVTMFPDRLASDLASLVTGELRPAFSVEARFDGNGDLVDFDVVQTTITVTERLSYESADVRLGQGDPMLSILQRIAERLCEVRATKGAQTHRRPEIKVRVLDGDVTVRRIEVDTPSRLIVSEMMILANRLVADKAAANGTPIIFRTQEPSTLTPPDMEGLPEAIQFEILRKGFKRSRLSLSPGPHSGLGLTAYTQISSPIRRYSDLITQRQCVAALGGAPIPYDREELLEILTSAESSELEIRRLEQASTTYWVMRYLAREMMDAPLAAHVVDQKGTVELDDYLIRAKVPGQNQWQMGGAVTVRIESIDPERGSIRLTKYP